MRAFTSLMDFSQSSLFFYRSFQFVILHLLTSICRARSEPGGTRWRTGGEVWGKLANGVGSQYSHATSERGISSITQADAHTSAASSRLNWHPHRFEWTRPFQGKTKSGFCVCAITFRTSYTQFHQRIHCSCSCSCSCSVQCAYSCYLHFINPFPP